MSDVCIDFSALVAPMKPVNGVNNAPLGYDDRWQHQDYLRDLFHQLKVPVVRLHDSHFPRPDVVDVPVVFPRFHLDVSDPRSYDFAQTDQYLQEIADTGAQIVYRLGTSAGVKPHPPEDIDKWAEVCVQIIRHCNAGWSDGLHLGIRYWEIWNEPDEGPRFWTGTMEDYLRLYEATVLKIKAYDADLKVGGPALARLVKREEAARCFLEHCRSRNLPLDFFSIHWYNNNIASLKTFISTARSLLEEYGFADTELHLNEWNYMDNQGKRLGRDLDHDQRIFDRQNGACGASFSALAMMIMQQFPLDMAHFYEASVGTHYNIISPGPRETPRKTYYLLKACADLFANDAQVQCNSPALNDEQVGCLASVSEKEQRGCLMISNFQSSQDDYTLELRNIPWPYSRFEIKLIDEDHDLEVVDYGIWGQRAVLRQRIPPSTILLIEFREEH